MQPTFPVEAETRKQVLVSQSETGARRAVRKSKAFRFYPLQFRGRPQAEYDVLQTVWSTNYPGSTIEWINATVNASGQFYFDSPLKWSPAFHNLLDYSVVMKRRDAQVIVVPGSNALPFGLSYGYEVNPQKEVLVSDSVSYSREAAALSPMRRLFNVGFRARKLSELLTMEQFWDHHYPCRQITFTEPVLNIEGDFWIDSNFKWRVLATGLVEYSFAIREV